MIRKYNVCRIVKAFRWLLSLTCFFRGTLCLMWQNYELWVIHCRLNESGHEGLKMPESPEVHICESECGRQHRADNKLGIQERTNVTISLGFKMFSFSNQWHDWWYVHKMYLQWGNETDIRAAGATSSLQAEPNNNREEVVAGENMSAPVSPPEWWLPSRAQLHHSVNHVTLSVCVCVWVWSLSLTEELHHLSFLSKQQKTPRRKSEKVNTPALLDLSSERLTDKRQNQPPRSRVQTHSSARRERVNTHQFTRTY